MGDDLGLWADGINKSIIIIICLIILIITALYLPENLFIEKTYENYSKSDFVFMALFFLIIAFFSWMNSFYWRLKYENVLHKKNKRKKC